jgi:hypothetical protein
VVAANKLAERMLNIDIKMMVLKEFRTMILIGHI